MYSNGPFDGIAEVKEYAFVNVFAVDSHELALELLLSRCEEVSVLIQLLSDLVSFLVSQFEPVLNLGVCLGYLFFREVHQLCEWIKVVLAQLSLEFIVLDLKCNHQLGCDLFVLKMLDLLQREWASIENPAIEAAVRLSKAFIHTLDDVVIGEHLLLLSHVTVAELLSILSSFLSPDVVSDELRHPHVDKLILFGHKLGKALLLRAWGTEQDDPLGALGSL